jgi:XTP/dITP diphosphohydrolase
MSEILIATTNQGKLSEYRQLFHGLRLEMVTLKDVGVNTVLDESYLTYAENAIDKASTYAAISGLMTLADDSGLEVEALGNQPGVKSARYAGENASDADRVNYLLSKLKNVPFEKRKAKFKCVIAIAVPYGPAQITEGECEGVIAIKPRGSNGFGYDPIFYFPELGKTMAELTPEVKNEISHRAKAAKKAYPMLEKLVGRE